jgi:hypothetical protein
LARTSPTSGGCWVGIVGMRTIDMELPVPVNRRLFEMKITKLIETVTVTE